MKYFFFKKTEIRAALEMIIVPSKSKYKAFLYVCRDETCIGQSRLERFNFG
ncbi:MAG: hypothetical protein JWP94_2295 [Mucilaginibacter sp.]|nr:hypothetical protein [Mucilaginibacter sp.]